MIYVIGTVSHAGHGLTMRAKIWHLLIAHFPNICNYSVDFKLLDTDGTVTQ